MLLWVWKVLTGIVVAAGPLDLVEPGWLLGRGDRRWWEVLRRGWFVGRDWAIKEWSVGVDLICFELGTRSSDLRRERFLGFFIGEF